jgi:hypothetical protein
MVICVFSVGWRPATPETYQSASGRPTRKGFSLLQMIYVEIFGGRQFCKNFAKIWRPKTHTPKFSRNFRPDHRKFGGNFESPSWMYDKVDFQSVSQRPGGPETQTNISINGCPRGGQYFHPMLSSKHVYIRYNIQPSGLGIGKEATLPPCQRHFTACSGAYKPYASPPGIYKCPVTEGYHLWVSGGRL